VCEQCRFLGLPFEGTDFAQRAHARNCWRVFHHASIRPPPLRNLRAFCAAARYRSFKAAADELFLTPSAVSHQMKELEEALGVRLFERKTRALELTTVGHTLLEEVEPLLEALDRSLAQIARRSGRQTLHVLLPPFFASELFIPRLASFARLTRRSTSGSIHAIRAPPATRRCGRVDPARDSEPQGLRSSRLFTVSLTAACSKEHVPTVARLGGEVFKTPGADRPQGAAVRVDELAEEVGLQPRSRRMSSSSTPMFAVVRAAERGNRRCPRTVGVMRLLVPLRGAGAHFSPSSWRRVTRIFS